LRLRNLAASPRRLRTLKWRGFPGFLGKASLLPFAQRRRSSFNADSCRCGHNSDAPSLQASCGWRRTKSRIRRALRPSVRRGSCRYGLCTKVRTAALGARSGLFEEEGPDVQRR
jgi:hypothetical protein